MVIGVSIVVCDGSCCCFCWAASGRGGEAGGGESGLVEGPVLLPPLSVWLVASSLVSLWRFL